MSIIVHKLILILLKILQEKQLD